MDATALAAALAAEGVQTRRYYSPPVHRQRAYRMGRPSNGALPVTDDAAARVLTLPLWTGMDDELVDRVGVAVARRPRPPAGVAERACASPRPRSPGPT